MTWFSDIAKRRIRIAQRLTLWAGEAEKRGKAERATELAKLAARQMKIAYDLELAHRQHTGRAA